MNTELIIYYSFASSTGSFLLYCLLSAIDDNFSIMLDTKTNIKSLVIAIIPGIGLLYVIGCFMMILREKILDWWRNLPE